jgi:hypothetical protein
LINSSGFVALVERIGFCATLDRTREREREREGGWVCGEDTDKTKRNETSRGLTLSTTKPNVTGNGWSEIHPTRGRGPID